MKVIAEFMRLIRYGQASMSVKYYDEAVDRAKQGLALALAARDAAHAEVRINEPAPTLPAFLLKKPTGVIA
jgi:hypothetical protein